MKFEVDSTARTRSLMALGAVADADAKGRLARHLKELEFCEPGGASEAVVYRGVVVRAHYKRSGTQGNVYRKNQLKAGTLTRGTKKWKRLKRGIDVEERWTVEQQRRQPRPYAPRAMKG